MLKKLQIKSWLLMLCMLVGVGNAWADELTILPGDGTEVTTSDYTITKDPISVAVTSSTLTADQIRVFKGQTITISSETATISGITLTCTENGTTKYGPGCLTGEGYTAGTSTTGTWSGSATSVTLTASSNQARITQIVVTYTPVGGSTPSISAQNVNIAYNATSGSIAYAIDNSVAGGSITSATVTASDPSGWLTVSNNLTSPIEFTCSANDAAASKTATVQLTYTYNTSETVTKNVIVTQAGNPNVVDNISDITEAGTYAVQGTIVAISNRGFVLGDGTGYVYYYEGSNFTPANYSIGDKKRLSGSITVYGGAFQFGSGTTITEATESNYVVEDPTTLTGTEMDSRVSSTTPAQLSSFVQYEGTLTVSGNYYNITNINGASTAKGSISYPSNTDFTSLDGKTVKVTGYYVGVSSSQYYNTMIGSVEEVTNAAPVINASDVTLEFDATSGEIGYTITNPVEGTSLTATTTAEWISNIAVVDETVTFTNTVNEGDADRTATITLTYGDVTKGVTVTQGHQTVDYATLPFAFDGGKVDIESTNGLTQTGLGSDYNNSPKLKFDSTDDNLVLKFNRLPGTLTFEIKGNGSGSDPWAGTFTVQASEDGETYEDLATYTELGATQSVEFNNLGKNVRYIKWVYTEKVSGNVALGNIKLAAPVFKRGDVNEDGEVTIADVTTLVNIILGKE